MSENILSSISDTQLPRYQVFLQEKPGLPHQDVGSVHASDAELALLNARDVFVRRPACTSLWVLPADCIFSRTRHELEAGLDEQVGPSQSGARVEPYYVTCKAKSSGTQTLLGEVQAASPAQALGQALHRFSFTPPPFAWWVFPARLVLSSDPAEIDSLFDPALDKPYRLSTDFHTLTQMRDIEKRRTEDTAEDRVTAGDSTHSG